MISLVALVLMLSSYSPYETLQKENCDQYATTSMVSWMTNYGGFPGEFTYWQNY